MLGVHLSRLAEDLVLFGTAEFGFVKFGERFTTGSSMMPQKRNPDVFELARGSGSRVLGDLTTLLATLKALPTGYNKDIQDDKRALFDAIDTVQRVLPAVAGALDECTFRADRMHASLSSAMMATDLADHLVEKGVSFRDAHGAVGRLVREAEKAGVELDALPLRSFTSSHAAFGADLFAALSPRRASPAARSKERPARRRWPHSWRPRSRRWASSRNPPAATNSASRASRRAPGSGVRKRKKGGTLSSAALLQFDRLSRASAWSRSPPRDPSAPRRCRTPLPRLRPAS